MQCCENVESWIGLVDSAPCNPLDVLLFAQLTGGAFADTGVFAYSTNYMTAPSPWVAGSLPVAGSPTCTALGTDEFKNLADAAQWNMQHQSWNSSSQLALPARRLMYFRGGNKWQAVLPLDFGLNVYSEFQISMLDNADKRGDCQGTTPVILFNARDYTGVVALRLTFKASIARLIFGIRVMQKNDPAPPTFSMWELEARIVD